jgi:hypothetical protein
MKLKINYIWGYVNINVEYLWSIQHQNNAICWAASPRNSVKRPSCDTDCSPPPLQHASMGMDGEFEYATTKWSVKQSSENKLAATKRLQGSIDQNWYLIMPRDGKSQREWCWHVTASQHYHRFWWSQPSSLFSRAEVTSAVVRSGHLGAYSLILVDAVGVNKKRSTLMNAHKRKHTSKINVDQKIGVTRFFDSVRDCCSQSPHWCRTVWYKLTGVFEEVLPPFS